jgi:hypothetical protein
MNDKLKPALIGGVILGILSAIPAVDYCCCIWAVIGGVIAANIYIKQSPVPVQPADGAVLGAIAGGIGAVLVIVLGIPLQLIVGSALMSMMQGIMQSANPEQAAQMRELMAAGVTFSSALIHALIWAVLVVIFAAVGGLLGVAIFEKRKGGAGAPPPPPAGGFGGPGAPGAGGYGGPTPGGGGTGGDFGQGGV